MQAVAWLILLAVNETVIAHPTSLVVLVAALSLLVVGGGLVIALTSPDRRQAQLLYSGGIVGPLLVASVLPEHPANTVAKLAVGNPTTTTWILLVCYCFVAIFAFLTIRTVSKRIDDRSL